MSKQDQLQALESLYSALHVLPKELRSQNWTSLEHETEVNIQMVAEELFGAEERAANGAFCD